MENKISKIAQKEALHKADVSRTLRWLKDELKFIDRKIDMAETSVTDAFTFFDAQCEITKVIHYIKRRIDYKQ
jgi:hypothetical protein